MKRSRIRVAAVSLTCAAALVACGQKPGVHVASGGAGSVQAQTGPVTTGQAAGGAATNPGSTSAAGGAGATTSGATAGGAGGDTDAAGAGATVSQTEPTTAGGAGQSSGQPVSDQQAQDGGAQPDASSQAQAQAQRQPQGSDTTGAGPDKLVFGSHAPVTGAAPLPTTSFEKSGDLYWRWVTEAQGGDVLGRKRVEILFRDDKYSPDSARQVCRELASKAFAVSGGGGTDQIQACGQLAEVGQFPYFSAGVTESGLRGNPWYFAASMSYKQQGSLLAQMVATRPETKGKKVGAIITNTPNFDDAVAGWEAGVGQQSLDYAETLRHPKGDTSWYATYAQQMKDAGVGVIYMLTSPVDYIRFSQVADEQFGYNPQYVGVGVSMGLNAVLGSGCKQGDPDARVGGGLFFSPFPALDWARQNVPEFFQAAEQFGVPNDDIALALWGTNAVLHEILERYRQVYGDTLTREDFRAFVETQQGIETGVFPGLSYAPDNHFGANQVHLLKADCTAGEYVSAGTFISGF